MTRSKPRLVEQCLNCDARLRGSFCHRCGQSAKVKSGISANHLVEVAVEVFMHWDSQKFPNTLLGIIRAPEDAVSNYVSGKRQAYQNPIAYFAVSYLIFNLAAKYAQIQNIEAGTFTRLNHWLYLLSALVPIGLAHLTVAKPRYTILETTTIFLYIYGTTFIILLAPLLIQFLIPKLTHAMSKDAWLFAMDAFHFFISTTLSIAFVIRARLSLIRSLLCAGLIALYLWFVEQLVASNCDIARFGPC